MQIFIETNENCFRHLNLTKPNHFGTKVFVWNNYVYLSLTGSIYDFNKWTITYVWFPLDSDLFMVWLWEVSLQFRMHFTYLQEFGIQQVAKFSCIKCGRSLLVMFHVVINFQAFSFSPLFLNCLSLKKKHNETMLYL